MMGPVWAWDGTFFGFLEGDHLWTRDGKHVGKRRGDNIYGSGGQYLGEVKEDDRLITDLAKSQSRAGRFTPLPRRLGSIPYADDAGYPMCIGHEEFPAPTSF